jgi:hypothetical protein
VNFAGHFVIDACTCGSGCHYLYMWDAVSGKFYQRLPPGVIDGGRAAAILSITRARNTDLTVRF